MIPSSPVTPEHSQVWLHHYPKRRREEIPTVLSGCHLMCSDIVSLVGYQNIARHVPSDYNLL